MKKSTSILVFLVISIISLAFLLSRDKTNIEVESLKHPAYDFYLLEGVWEIEDVKDLSDLNKDKKDLDKKFYIDKKLVAFGDVFTAKPNFSAKYVDVDKYLKSNYKTEAENSYGSKPIISIYDGSKFYQEIIKIDDNNIILPYNESLYKLKKTAKKVDQATIKEYEDLYNSKYYANKAGDHEDILKEAVLLGIKRSSENKDDDRYDYRTVLLALNEHDEVSLYESNTFLFPRKDGFWQVSNIYPEVDKKDNTIEIKTLKEDSSSDNLQVMSKEFPMEILHLDPSYISIRTYLDNGVEEFGTYSIDGFSKNQKLNIEQLGGENAIKSLESIVAKEKTKDESLLSVQNIAKYSNLGVEKDLGRPSFQTQFQYSDKESVKLKNIKIDFVPQIDIMKDELVINWQSIKNLEKDAIDAFSSPDKRILLIEKQDEILVYLLNPDAKLLGSIRKGINDNIIMAEWAEGDYVDRWTDTIKNTDVIPSTFLPN
ncbi:MAG: hypothetical protein SPI59_05985 [Finegoldia sp.]|nr:hypothetical protein [Finegoldia sp.]